MAQGVSRGTGTSLDGRIIDAIGPPQRKGDCAHRPSDRLHNRVVPSERQLLWSDWRANALASPQSLMKLA